MPDSIQSADVPQLYPAKGPLPKKRRLLGRDILEGTPKRRRRNTMGDVSAEIEAGVKFLLKAGFRGDFEEMLHPRGAGGEFIGTGGGRKKRRRINPVSVGGEPSAKVAAAQDKAKKFQRNLSHSKREQQRYASNLRALEGKTDPESKKKAKETAELLDIANQAIATTERYLNQALSEVATLMTEEGKKGRKP